MVNDALSQVYFNNTLYAYVKSLILFLLLFLIIRLVEKLILRKLLELSKKTKTSFDDFLIDVLKKIAVPVAYFGALYLSLISLQLNTLFYKGLKILTMAVVVFSVSRLIVALITYAFSMYWRKRGKDIVMEKSLSGILRILTFIVWALAIIFFLDNLGFKISAVIAGLGIGGVAVALAAQAVLSDLFSYFAILFDRPFEIGDFIIVGDFMGVVDHIGIKTTRISSLGGEQLIFSNSDLTNSRVRNYKRMNKRRVLFKLGVTYDTSIDRIKEIPGIIERIIKAIPDTTFDRAHFSSYGDFSLIYEVVYYVEGPDYNKYMDIQQKINFALKEQFTEQGIEFAFPTQTVYVNNPN